MAKKSQPRKAKSPAGRSKRPAPPMAPDKLKKEETPPLAQEGIETPSLGGHMAEKRVIVEVRMPKTSSAREAANTLANDPANKLPGLRIDQAYPAVPMSPPPDAVMDHDNEQVVAIRGTVEEAQEAALRNDPRVVAVWSDAPIDYHARVPLDSGMDLELTAETGPCPCSPCDCDSSDTGAKGTLADVAAYLGVDRLWAAGYRGDGIVIGVCDGGVRRSEVPALIDGWVPTNAAPWGDDNSHPHGTMCAVDALGVCPQARILDIGILKARVIPGPAGRFAGLVSHALAAYEWVLERYRRTGTPQVLTNSWGMQRESDAPDYAGNPNHIFTRKVVELIDAGILVCFSAGNGGQRCPSEKVGPDVGPGRSIWGANGHPDVLTVGAANIRNEWIGYSSQGPAALDLRKPDVCAPSHFRGYTRNDNGTSAACPVAAGVLGLLRQARPDLRLAEAKRALQQTAHPICSTGWDPHSGYGIVRAAAAAVHLGITLTPGQLPPPSTLPPPGVQFRGTIPANSTQSWVTSGWPARWHVYFALMPTRPAPAGAEGPQLRCKVSPERTSAESLTYWIEVTNVSPHDVEFEARYRVLAS